MNAVGAFFTRFSKAIGALGGGGIGALIAWGIHLSGHTLSAETVGILPVVGSVIATALAPPNSLTTPLTAPGPTNADGGAYGGSSG